MSQIGACRVGERRLRDILEKLTAPGISLATALLDYTERLLRAELASAPKGAYTAENLLDGDGPILIRVSLTFDPAARSATIDFTGSPLRSQPASMPSSPSPPPPSSTSFTACSRRMLLPPPG